MTKPTSERGPGRIVGALGAFALGALLVLCLGAVRPAEAAQVYITNCVDKEVKICSADTTNALGWNQKHKLQTGDTGHFTCKVNCVFVIADCKANGNCDECLHSGMQWLDHSWSKGHYRLNSLDTSSKGTYQSSDLVKVDDAVTSCSP